VSVIRRHVSPSFQTLRAPSTKRRNTRHQQKSSILSPPSANLRELIKNNQKRIKNARRIARHNEAELDKKISHATYIAQQMTRGLQSKDSFERLFQESRYEPTERSLRLKYENATKANEDTLLQAKTFLDGSYLDYAKERSPERASRESYEKERARREADIKTFSSLENFVQDRIAPLKRDPIHKKARRECGDDNRVLREQIKVSPFRAAPQSSKPKQFDSDLKEIEKQFQKLPKNEVEYRIKLMKQHPQLAKPGYLSRLEKRMEDIIESENGQV
jgi:hypothetical protein